MATLNRPSQYHRDMIYVHSAGLSGARCRDCTHLCRKSPGRRHVLKCELAYQSMSAASDWRAGWPACGKFEARAFEHPGRTEREG